MKKVLVLKIFTIKRLFTCVMAIVALASVAYGFNEIMEIKKENIALRNEISGLVKTESATSSEQSSLTSTEDLVVATEKEVAVEEVKTSPNTRPQKEVAEDAVVYIPPTQEYVPVIPPAYTDIKVIAIRQTAHLDGYGGTYGAYEMEIEVTSTESDIFIPPSTTNTIGTGNIGFSYTIAGDYFRGKQTSQVSCDLMNKGYCKTSGNGEPQRIIVTVFLHPDRGSDGNYGLMFDSIHYYKNGAWSDMAVNRQTATINVRY